MKQGLAVLALCLSCSGHHGYWVKPNSEPAAARLERYECERDAWYAQQSLMYGTTFGTDEEREGDCLRAHGWVFVGSEVDQATVEATAQAAAAELLECESSVTLRVVAAAVWEAECPQTGKRATCEIDGSRMKCVSGAEQKASRHR